jgi:hypothetical protein
MTQFKIDSGYRFLNSQQFSAQALYSFWWEEIWSVTALRLFDQRVAIPVAFRTPVWLIETRPEYKYQVLDKHPFSSVPGVSIRVQHGFGRQDVGFSYGWDDNHSLISESSGLSGLEQKRRVYWTLNSEDSIFTISYWNIVDRVGDLRSGFTVIPLANNAQGPAIDFTWQFAENWAFEADVSYFFLRYLSKSEPESIPRNDHQLEMYYKFDWRFARSWKFYLSAQAVVNDSTMGTYTPSNKNYGQFIGLGGFTYELF